MLMTLAVLSWLVGLVFGLAVAPAYFWWLGAAGILLALLHLIPPRKTPPLGKLPR